MQAMQYSFVSILCVLLTFGQLTTAQVPFPNHCPEVNVMNEFDVDAYMGIWYEYAKYPFIFEIGKKCMYARYQNIGNDTVSVMNAAVNRFTGAPSNVTGIAKVMGPARLAVAFSKNQNTDRANYLVLGTDYKSWSVVYSCTNFTPIAHTKIVWILTRDRKPSDEVIKAAKMVIDENHLSQTFLIETNQTDCPVINSLTGEKIPDVDAAATSVQNLDFIAQSNVIERA